MYGPLVGRLSPGSVVVDIGCGAGFFAPLALETARAPSTRRGRLRRSGRTCAFGSAPSLTLSCRTDYVFSKTNGQYSQGVFCIDVVEHIETDEGMLSLPARHSRGSGARWVFRLQGSQRSPRSGFVLPLCGSNPSPHFYHALSAPSSFGGRLSRDSVHSAPVVQLARQPPARARVLVSPRTVFAVRVSQGSHLHGESGRRWLQGLNILPQSRKILLLTASLAPGGAETVVMQLAIALRASRCSVTVISMLEPSAFVDELRDADVQVISLGMRPRRLNITGIWRFSAIFAASVRISFTPTCFMRACLPASRACNRRAGDLHDSQ